jgi:hypothetical protein
VKVLLVNGERMGGTGTNISAYDGIAEKYRKELIADRHDQLGGGHALRSGIPENSRKSPLMELDIMYNCIKSTRF